MQIDWGKRSRALCSGQGMQLELWYVAGSTLDPSDCVSFIGWFVFFFYFFFLSSLHPPPPFFSFYFSFPFSFPFLPPSFFFSLYFSFSSVSSFPIFFFPFLSLYFLSSPLSNFLSSPPPSPQFLSLPHFFSSPSTFFFFQFIS